MNGYVRNKSSIWRHAMKRSVGPGEKIPLKDLYQQYGIKHDLGEGKPFIEWLRYVKLKDINVWEIKYEEESEDLIAPVSSEEDEPKKKVEVKKGFEQTPSTFVRDTDKLTVDEIANFSVRTAREKLPRIIDLKLLKYSLHVASKLANKDTLCRMLKKRVQELELTSRI
jgi:hypothetical protein